MIRRLIKLLVISLSFSLSGCWSSIEINQRSFARFMFIDKSDIGVELTLGFPLPNRMVTSKAGGENSSPPFTYVTKSSEDISRAYSKILSDLPRRVTFGQMRNIFISKQLATEVGLEPFIDFLSRQPALHLNVNLFVVDGNSKEVGSIPMVFERFLTDILLSYTKEKIVHAVTIKNMLTSIYRKGDFALPILFIGKAGVEFEKEGAQWMGTSGMAIFRNAKMVGTFDMKETKGARWLFDDVYHAQYRVISPTDGKLVTLMVRSSNTKIVPSINSDHIQMNILCRGDATVMSSESNIDLTNPRELKSLEQSFESLLEGIITKTIIKSKAMKSDVFQLGQLIKWRYPNEWNSVEDNWRNTYESKIVIDQQVDISIKRIGAVQKPEWNRFLHQDEEHQ
ncbi:Ger(x)C family spore germination protein [Paenibacillus sp. WC2504]|uniref:Ger(x)C family spore germination protein n=1 Tax=Paenibacillus sp. WC2504 TaxID=3461403 RepID=UPI00404523BC